LGEFGLIKRIRSRSLMRHARVLLGIGDDAAVLRPSSHHTLLTTDLLIESVHFDFSLSSPRQIGAKAVLVNASDIAAMGGTPQTVLVSLAVPGPTPVKQVDKLYTGIIEACHEVGADLVGGDTAASPGPTFINVTMTGVVPSGCEIRRSGGNPGDLLYVTGTLGDSRAGLSILQSARKGRHRSFEQYLIRRHLRPIPRIAEGAILAKTRSASAMIDLSDGLSSDVIHLCEESDTGVRIDISRIPVSEQFSAWCRRTRRKPGSEAIRGGEDYELLFSVRPRHEAKIEKWIRTGGLSATRIGFLTGRKSGFKILDERGRLLPLREEGFSHF
jgi:thiamine-monophosphate kinase